MIGLIPFFPIASAEMHRAINVPVVGHRGRSLAQLAQVRGQLVHIAGPIQQAVIGVEMQMRKVGGHALILGRRRCVTDLGKAVPNCPPVNARIRMRQEPTPMVRKQRGYKITIDDDVVIVEHRATYTRPRSMLASLLGLAFWTWYSYEVGPIADFRLTHQVGDGVLAAIYSIVPFFAGAAWIFFSSGEVMRCTPQDLQFAHRTTWRRWQRFRYTPPQVQKLQRVFRMLHRNESYFTLTFQHKGRPVDMLQAIPVHDADLILQACKSMGWDAVVIVDPGVAMNHDIEQRGWFVNPWRNDDAPEAGKNG